VPPSTPAAARVLTFDCYGTLIDWERGILDALEPWAAGCGLRIGPDALLEAFAGAEAQCEAEMPGLRYPAILEQVLRRLGARWGVVVDEADAAAFGQSVRRWPAFADSAAALRYLGQRCRLVVVSNVDRASFAFSQAALGVTFDLVVTAEDVGSYKPDLRNFRFALARIEEAFGVGPSGVLHVAQSLYHDIVPARAVGLRTVWINRRKGRAGWGATPPPPVDGDAARPDFEVPSLAALVELFRSAEASSSP